MLLSNNRCSAARAFSRRSVAFVALPAVFALLTACGGGGSGGNDEEIVAVEAPNNVSLSVEAIKTFRFDWTDVENATRYQLLENPDGLSDFTRVGEDVPQGTQTLGFEVPLHTRINAQYKLRACSINSCTDSDPVSVSGNLAEGIGYFKASNAEEFDFFGAAVSLSANGNTLAVGADREDSSATGVNGDESDNSVTQAGAVYIFARTDAGWNQVAYLKASNTGAFDSFGEDVSLSADGNTLAVGAPDEDSSATGVNGDESDNSVTRAGAVYIFARTNAGWNQVAYLKASNAEASDSFGEAVSLSADGTTLGVGAGGEDSGATGVNGDESDNSVSRAGAVYVFTRTDAGWNQVAYLKASNTGENDEFGEAISLSADGTTLAAGALGEDSSAKGVNGDETDNTAIEAGAVYIFARTNAGWNQVAYLKASNAEADDIFGDAVSLNADGTTLAVGASEEGSSATGVNGDESDNSADGAGAVYVFARTAGGWSQAAYLKASNTDVDDSFGNDVSLSSDGTILAVGADEEESLAIGINGDEADNSAPLGSGAVYIFERKASGWSQTSYVKASNTEDADDFGEALSLSGNGRVLAVRSDSEDSSATGIGGDQTDNTASGAGAVYLY
ncbi:integrin [Marinobacter halotolerans]|uniref:integrin n=1 Tax=Marinobacter halotolerans TaxID=1569211 RepID=UPI00124549E7|nr:integrin [Marinobacter halotolerans]